MKRGETQDLELRLSVVKVSSVGQINIKSKEYCTNGRLYILSLSLRPTAAARWVVSMVVLVSWHLLINFQLPASTISMAERLRSESIQLLFPLIRKVLDLRIGSLITDGVSG
jgi:hypothetical protein